MQNHLIFDAEARGERNAPLYGAGQEPDTPFEIACAFQFQLKQSRDLPATFKRSRWLVPPCHFAGLLPWLLNLE